MSNELKEKISNVEEMFKDFSNYIELEDFRSFLLFTINSQVPSNILAQMGFGNSKDIINLPYNPLLKIHYQKINLMTAGSLIVYVKGKPISGKFLVEKDDPIFKEYFGPNELKLAFRGKEKILIPEISDCSSTDESEIINVKIDDLFHSLQSFMAVTTPNIVFVIEGNDGKPDLLFAFNIMPEMPGSTNKKVLKIDIFLDTEHITKEKNYIKREEDYSIELLEDIKEISHSDLYKSAFSLILRVKSLNNP